MSLKQRLRNAERKMGTADDEPVEFQTLYENEDGSADEVSPVGPAAGFRPQFPSHSRARRNAGSI